MVLPPPNRALLLGNEDDFGGARCAGAFYPKRSQQNASRWSAKLMPALVTVERLSQHVAAVPLLTRWFEAEWPAWYGPGGSGSAEQDLHAFSSNSGLPIGVIALLGGSPCGVAALKERSIPTHEHLSPWAAAGYVVPALRGQGIGQRLLSALEAEAKTQGFQSIFCGSATAGSLLLRSQWHLTERILHEGKSLGIYAKAL